MRALSIVAMVVMTLAVSQDANAHHSYAEFGDQPITLEGTIDRVEFTNPHTVLTIHDSDKRIHSIIWNAAFQLQSMGVHATDLKVGDEVELIGYPSRDAEIRQIAKLQKLRRPSDGWTWQMINGHATVGHLPQ